MKKNNVFGGLLLVLVVSLLTMGAGCAKQNANNQTGATSAVSVTNDELTQNTDPTGNRKTYTDAKVGFSFEYPSNATNNGTKGVEGLVFDVKVNDLDTMQDAPSGYDKANALKDKTALSKGDPSTLFGWVVLGSYKMLNIKNALAKELTVFQQFEMCDVQFNRQAIIYKDNYQIILSWMYAGKDIQKNNPNYFITDSANCGSEMIWIDGQGLYTAKSFYTDLVAGKTDAVSQNWFNSFDEIIKTFQFTDKTTRAEDMTGWKTVITYPINGSVIDNGSVLESRKTKIKGTARPNSNIWAFVTTEAPGDREADRACLSGGPDDKESSNTQADSKGNFEFDLDEPCSHKVWLYVASEDVNLGKVLYKQPQWKGLCQSDSERISFTLSGELPVGCK